MPHAARLFARLVLEACSTLTTLSQCDDAPDTTDDTFLLAASGLQQCPAIVLQPQVLPSLLASAAAGALVQHRSAPLPALCWHTQGLHAACCALQGEAAGLQPAAACASSTRSEPTSRSKLVPSIVCLAECPLPCSCAAQLYTAAVDF